MWVPEESLDRGRGLRHLGGGLEGGREWPCAQTHEGGWPPA